MPGDRFLDQLVGVEDPEKKRRDHRPGFIEVFEEQASDKKDVRFLAQGTLYPDVIESASVKGPSAVIKTHHNVGGLPEKLGFELIEPLRWFSKTKSVASVSSLGFPEELIGRHPFPGPGLAVRILGEVTADRVALLQERRRASSSRAQREPATTTRSARRSPCCYRSRVWE